MKVAGAIVIALIAVGTLVAVWAAAYGIGYRKGRNDRLGELGLTKEAVALYERAKALMVRLAQLSDLDGMLAGDNLSPQTKELVAAWVTDYRKEVSRS